MSRTFDEIDITQVASYPRPGMAIPGSIGFTPDSRRVTYLASEEGTLVRSLFEFDPETGEQRVLAGPGSVTGEEAYSREEELRRERMRLREVGVTSYQFARHAETPVLLVPQAQGLRALVADRWIDIPGTGGALDPAMSRDGTKVLFARDGELWAAAIDEAAEPVQLTSGAEDGLTNGVAEFIAAEELGRDRGAWWAPGGDAIAYIQADSRHIPDYPIVHQGVARPDVEHHRYPFAGEANAVLKLGIIAASGGDTRWLDTGDPDSYIARVAWRPSGTLVAEILSRDQRRLTVYEYALDGSRSLLREEESEPWLNLGDETRYLESGEVLFSSERSGFRHLYLRAANGEERPLTAGEWVVTALVGLDEGSREAWFMATRESVLERHLYRVSLDGGEATRVTDEPCWHSIAMAPDCSGYVDTYSNLEQSPRVSLHAADGLFRAEIPVPQPTTAEELGLAPPELGELPAADGTMLHAALYEGRGDRSPRPLIISVYGGPHAQRVARDWSLTVDLRAQYLARRGYTVLKVDSRGSDNRGLAFEAFLDRRFGTVEVDDQVAAIEWLAARGDIDPGRVGIYGWSYGGYMTAMCMMRRPDLFRAGVAGAPVADWDGYDTGYTERYMGTPRDNPDGYREGSLLTHANRLEGKLLLVHGGVDENVHFRHTARLITALTAAQKEYDLVLYPEERHMPRDQAGLEYMERRLAAYFDQHL